ncbi:hypothetical protein [Paenibacillus dendritiformis]
MLLLQGVSRLSPFTEGPDVAVPYSYLFWLRDGSEYDIEVSGST